jgi:hypothetical protein
LEISPAKAQSSKEKGKNSYELFLFLCSELCGLGGFAGDIPTFGCNTTALLAPPACQNRRFQIFKMAIVKGTVNETSHNQT